MRFWKGKKIFLTGHTGFKGSWLSIWLNTLGAKVTGFSREVPDNGLFASGNLKQIVDSRIGDIRNLDQLTSELENSSPELIFHLAAQSLVRPSYADPVATMSTNVMGTVNILEAARRVNSVKAVVIVTSDKCYENKEWLKGYKENDPMGGYDPYSASKGCAELITAAYRQSFFQNGRAAVATARAGNVIGGGDWAVDRLIPDIVRALSNGTPVLIRNPIAVRPWQHVCEPLWGYLMLAESLSEKGEKYAEAWNFGPDEDDAKSVAWVVDYICEKWGDGACWHHDNEDHPHEANFLKLDCSKAKERLDWHPRLDISTALDWTIAWYKEFLAEADIRNIVESQIGQYINLCQNDLSVD